MPAETEQQRRRRLHQRTLFDPIARLYQETRPDYPDQIIEFIATTAGLGTGSRVLEIGCGTGQLTRTLASRGRRPGEHPGHVAELAGRCPS